MKKTLRKIKTFDLSLWLMRQRAKRYSRQADRAIARYRKKIGPKAVRIVHPNGDIERVEIKAKD